MSTRPSPSIEYYPVLPPIEDFEQVPVETVVQEVIARLRDLRERQTADSTCERDMELDAGFALAINMLQIDAATIEGARIGVVPGSLLMLKSRKRYA